jgi:hypothetical protein
MGGWLQMANRKDEEGSNQLYFNLISQHIAGGSEKTMKALTS